MQNLLVTAASALALLAAPAAAQIATSQGSGARRPLSLVDLAPPSSAASNSTSQSGASGLSGGPGKTFAPFYQVGTLDAGTGFQESFLYSFPTPLPAAPAPLLVAFHSYNVSPKEIVQRTRFLEEAHARGWYLVAPLSAHDKHFCSPTGQINTQAVIDFMLAHFDVDPQRIYGVGFSMGGGAVANYAARHLDPAHGMFAAVVAHTGTIALEDVYANEPLLGWVLDAWYGTGAPGSATPWKLQRSSILNFDQGTLLVDRSSDLARNLQHVPLYVTRASSDPIWYLPRQSDVLDQHLMDLGRVPGVDYEYVIEPFSGHAWQMLDFKLVCDWLDQQVLQLPTSGDTLVDRDGVYFHFLVEQDLLEVWTPFSWELDPATNAFEISDSTNLRRVTVDTVAAGLDPTLPLTVRLGTADGLGDAVGFTDLPLPPTQVLRDGVAAPAGSWVYQVATDTVVLFESDGTAQHVWEVVP